MPRDAGWPVGTQAEPLVRPGSVIAVTEDARVVAYFTVHHVADS